MARTKTVKAQLQEALHDLELVTKDRERLQEVIRSGEKALGTAKSERDAFRHRAENLASAARTAKERLSAICNNTGNNETVRLALLYITSELSDVLAKG